MMEDLEINTTDDFNAAGGERAMSEWARRLLAGAWFALAAVVPVAYLVLSNPFGGEGFSGFYGSMILTVGVPMFVAGVCGLGLGADILNQEETKNAFQAVGRGLLVSLLSYLVLFVGLAVVLLPGSDDFIGLIVVGVFFFLYGLLFLGWLVALIGAAAGGLLYFYRRRRLGF